MKITVVLIFAVLLISSCAPSEQLIQEAVALTQTAMPTLTVIPSTEPTATTNSPSLAVVLGNNDFSLGEDPFSTCQGGYNCTSYIRLEPWMLADVTDNGALILQDFAKTGGVLDVKIFYLVLTQAYGQDITDWTANHLEASLSSEQKGSIGNYDIWLTGDKNKVKIVVSPKN